MFTNTQTLLPNPLNRLVLQSACDSLLLVEFLSESHILRKADEHNKLSCKKAPLVHHCLCAEAT